MTSLDDGTLRVNAIHVGDGYHLVTCECDVCGEEATKTYTAPKARIGGIKDLWFQQHWHNP
ncbi:MAG: hypothetical protein ACRDJ3_08660 [Solirubrobacteraceae bacterium]